MTHASGPTLLCTVLRGSVLDGALLAEFDVPLKHLLVIVAMPGHDTATHLRYLIQKRVRGPLAGSRVVLARTLDERIVVLPFLPWFEINQRI
jgi:hypothetical protein